MKRVYGPLAFVLSLASAVAEPITSERIRALPPAEQPAWITYLERSEQNARADRAALQAELDALAMTTALRAPVGGNFKLPDGRDPSWYASDEARRLADVVLSYQTPAGGWSKHTAYSRGPRKGGTQWGSQNEPGRPWHYIATFDNRATTEELYLLARVWRATKRPDCSAAVVRGLNFILTAQFPNGGWPQVYPLEGAYHDNITFNDDAITRILELLCAIQRGEPDFAFLDEPQRQKAAAALAAGIRCVCQAQITQNGKKTAWCAQHDGLTLRPSRARPMEPPSLSGAESAHVLRFLMTITNPAPEVVAAIEGGLAWLEQVKIKGLTRAKRDGITVHEQDPASTRTYWARFYDLTSSKPIFPGRDGIIYDTFAAMAAQNKLGYDYYTTLPGSILSNGQAKWRKMLSRLENGSPISSDPKALTPH
jgi:PelA/Pel-15E family pectate lyase